MTKASAKELKDRAKELEAIIEKLLEDAVESGVSFEVEIGDGGFTVSKYGHINPTGEWWYNSNC